MAWVCRLRPAIGWEAMRATVPGLTPIEERNVVLVGVRDLDAHQCDRLSASAIRVVRSESSGAVEYRRVLDDVQCRVTRMYLHVDLDALDPADGIANRYAAPQGLRVEQLLAALRLVFDRFQVVAVALTAYDPTPDIDGRMAETATRVLSSVAGAPRPGRPAPHATVAGRGAGTRGALVQTSCGTTAHVVRPSVRSPAMRHTLTRPSSESCWERTTTRRGCSQVRMTVESSFNGAAQESNLPRRGLHARTGFEDRLGHRAHAAPGPA